MFEWIGDTVEWLEDGISDMWDNTVAPAVSSVSEDIWDHMFKWLFDMVYGAAADLFEFINSSSSNIFSLAWVQSFVALFSSLAWMLFGCGLAAAVFDTAVAYESGQANIKNTCLNVLKGFMAAGLVTTVPQRLYSFCVALQGKFSYELLGSFTGSASSVAESGLSVIAELAADVSLFNLLFIILFAYCTVKVVLANIKRGGILLCQTAVGSLYMFDVPRGYADGFSGWCKQVIATCLTAFLQTTILYLGLLTFYPHPLLAAGICLSSTEVPRIAQMYGLDTSVRVNMTSVSHTVNMGARALGLVKGK